MWAKLPGMVPKGSKTTLEVVLKFEHNNYL